MGWIAIHDPIGAFDPEIRKGLSCLSQKTIGSNSIVQGALARILRETPQDFHDNLIETLHESAKVAYNMIEEIEGLVPYMPKGTMYLMVKIDLDHFPYFQTELDFIQKLMEEESVFCLPGQVRLKQKFCWVSVKTFNERCQLEKDNIQTYCFTELNDNQLAHVSKNGEVYSKKHDWKRGR